MSRFNAEEYVVISAGTPAYSVRWTVNKNLHMFRKYKYDCGRLCPDSSNYQWKQWNCDGSLQFVCEYGKLIFTNSLSRGMLFFITSICFLHAFYNFFFH